MTNLGEAMRAVIKRTETDEVEISKLVRKNRYDELIVEIILNKLKY